MKVATLTPRHDEICVNGNIRISVSRVERGRVRIAIDAPRDVRVDRAEVRERCNAAPQPTGEPGTTGDENDERSH